MEWLQKVLEFQVAPERAVYRHRPFDVLDLQVPAAAQHLDHALDIHQSADVAALDFHFGVPPDLVQTNSGIVADDLNSAGQIGDVEIPVAAAPLHARPARHDHFQIRRQPALLGNFFLVGSHDHTVALHNHFERTLLVDGVGVAFVVGSNRLVARDSNLRRIAPVHAHIASDVVEQDSRVLSDLFLLRYRIVERFAEYFHRSRPDVEWSPRTPELENRGSYDAQQNQQENLPSRKSARRQRLRAGRVCQYFEQPQHAQTDQQKWPVFRE